MISNRTFAQFNENPIPEDKEATDIKSYFYFVGFGWEIKNAFSFEFNPDEYEPDEVYLVEGGARDRFLSRYPRVSAAVFYQTSVFLRLKDVCSYSDLRCPKRYVLFSVPCSKRAMLERWV